MYAKKINVFHRYQSEALLTYFSVCPVAEVTDFVLDKSRWVSADVHTLIRFSILSSNAEPPSLSTRSATRTYSGGHL